MPFLTLVVAVLSHTELVSALVVSKWLDEAKETLLRLSATAAKRDTLRTFFRMLWLAFCATVIVFWTSMPL